MNLANAWLARLGRPPGFGVLMVAGAVVVALLGITQGDNNYLMNIVIFTMFWATAATGWNILGGYVGLLSLGHSLFFGCSAYAVIVLVTQYHFSWWLAMAASVGGVTIVGTLILYPSFRLRGPFFSLATFALPTVASIIAIYEVQLTGGPQGLTWPLQVDPSTFNFQSRIPYLVAAAGFLAVALSVSRLLAGRHFGIYMLATRDDDIAAEAAGVPTTRVRLVAAIISIAITALCGGFYVAYIAFLDPTSAFSLEFSLKVVLLSILGGMGTVYGPLLGAILLVPIDFALSAAFSGGLHLLLYGLLLMVVVLFLPQGLIGEGANLSRRLRRRRG